jgi:hypothetical protein
MGKTDPGYSLPMRDKINGSVAKKGVNPSDIAWQEVFWSDVLKLEENRYLSNVEKSKSPWGWGWLRDFVVTALGDAAGYHGAEPTDPKGSYDRVHQVIRKSMEAFGDIHCPLVVMAHSLGGIMISDYIWDVQKNKWGKAEGLDAFRKFETLAGMVTFGCNIPLFTFAYDPVVPIEFPARTLDPVVKAKAEWRNYYDPADVLGYPLKPINALYDRVVTKDISISVGGILESWNPLSHIAYWTDDGFTRSVAGFFKSLMS